MTRESDEKGLELPPGTAPARDPGRAPARREYRHDRPGDGQFRTLELRLVNPKNGWPKKGVREAASGATYVLDRATIFPTVAEALADLNFVLATTARERGQMKRVFAPDEGMAEVCARPGQRIGVMFGRERVGLSNARCPWPTPSSPFRSRPTSPRSTSPRPCSSWATSGGGRVAERRCPSRARCRRRPPVARR